MTAEVNLTADHEDFMDRGAHAARVLDSHAEYYRHYRYRSCCCWRCPLMSICVKAPAIPANMKKGIKISPMHA